MYFVCPHCLSEHFRIPWNVKNVWSYVPLETPGTKALENKIQVLYPPVASLSIPAYPGVLKTYGRMYL